MMLIDFMNMKNGDYHNKQIEYNMSGLLAEIKQRFPDDPNPNLSDPKYRDIVFKMPYTPLIAGGLAESLGIRHELLTLSLWEDLSNGYCPTAFLPKDSPLEEFAIETPRGQMVKLNRNATPISELGDYQPEKAGKDRRIGTEFVFGLGRNTSLALTALELEDPANEIKLTKEVNRIFTDYIIPEMTKDAMIRMGTDGEQLGYVKELLVASFHHTESRTTDPYKHWHVDLLNTAMGEDGQLYSLRNDLIIQNKDKYTAIFQSKVKSMLERDFGLEFDAVYLDEDRDNEYLKDPQKNICSYDVKDEFIPAALRDEMSSRTKEIDAEMRKKGVKGFLAEEIARKETRAEKTELSPSELKAQWHDTFTRHGFSAETIHAKQDFSQVYNPEAPVPDSTLLVSNFMRKHKDVAFTEDQFVAHITKQLLGTHTEDRAKRLANELFEAQGVQMLDKEQADFFKPFLDDTITNTESRKQKQIRFGRDVRFTTQSVLDMDRYISESLKARQGEAGFQISKQQAGKAVLDFERSLSTKDKPFKFAQGQKDAVIQSLSEPGAVFNIAGRAGAGKSTLLKCVREEYIKEGFTVLGTSISSTATKGLAESTGMKKDEFFNTTDLLNRIDNGKLKLSPKHLVMVDEAGMMDTESFYRLIKHANNAGAKLILTGEKEQLQAVGFGGSFKILNEQFITAPVKDINRQRDSWQREMVEDFASGRSAKAMKALYDEGRVAVTKTDSERIELLVADYLADRSDAKQKLIIATTNEDVEKLNMKVREQLKKSGTVSTDEVTVQCKDGIEREFSKGDRIMFTKNQKSDDVDQGKLSNSETGSVIHIQKTLAGRAVAIKVRMDNGKEHFLNVNKEHSMKHAYCSTVHKSQGQTKENSYYYVSSTLNSLHTAYVACSRHKGMLKMYLSDDMVNKLVDKMQDKGPTPQMKKVAEWAAKKAGVELPPEVLGSFIATREFLDNHYKKAGGTTEKPHAMDSFVSIAEAMSKTQFKKTTWDFQIADGKAVNAYREIRMERDQRLEPAKIKVPVLKPKLKQSIAQTL